MSTREDRPIALVGLMGAGKTAVARVLGERLAVAVADLDAMIEAELGRSIAELFEHEGEPWFRRREGEILASALEAGARVLACGGGIVIDAGQRRLLVDRCRVVWLEVSPATAARRVAAEPRRRPLLLEGGSVEARLADLLGRRAPLYEEVAEQRVVTDGRTPEEVADAVLSGVQRKTS